MAGGASCDAGRACLLAGVASQDLQHWLPGIRHVSYSPRRVLFEEATPIGGLYVLCRGSLKLTKRLPNGRELILHLLQDGAVLGEELLIGERWHRYGAEVVEDSQLLLIDRAVLPELLRRHPTLEGRLLSQLIHQTLELKLRLECLLHPGALGKLLTSLLGWTRRYGQLVRSEPPILALQVPLRRQELASWLGCSRETISRCLQQAQDRGWIDVQGARWHITLNDRLRWQIGPDAAADWELRPAS